jgi:hypothetical protein
MYGLISSPFCSFFIFSSCTIYPDAYVGYFKVHARGMMLFSEVASLLQHLKNERPDALTLAVSCGLSLSVKDFSELEQLLMKEKADFEVGIFVLISIGLSICSFYYCLWLVIICIIM